MSLQPRRRPMRTARQDLHRLVDELPKGAFKSARNYLVYLRNMNDPLLKKLLEAPFDDEPLTEEDLAAVAEADQDFRAGRVVSHEEIKRGLRM